MGQGCMKRKPTAPALALSTRGPRVLAMTTFPFTASPSTGAPSSTKTTSPSASPVAVIGSVRHSTLFFTGATISRLEPTTLQPGVLNVSR